MEPLVTVGTRTERRLGVVVIARQRRHVHCVFEVRFESDVLCCVPSIVGCFCVVAFLVSVGADEGGGVETEGFNFKMPGPLVMLLRAMRGWEALA